MKRQIFCAAVAAVLAFSMVGCKPEGRTGEEVVSGEGVSGYYESTENGSEAADSGSVETHSNTSVRSNSTSNNKPGKVITPTTDEVKDYGSFKVHTKDYPFITDGSHTITVMLPMGELAEIGKQKAAIEYEKKTGLKIKWQSYNYSDGTEVFFQAMIQSGNLPDIYCAIDVASTPSVVQKYGSQGYYPNLAPYLEKWAPNLKARLDNKPVMKKLSTTSDGKLYGLPSLDVEKGEENKAAMLGIAEAQYFINTKWLKNLGLSKPVTTDDFYKVCKAFTEQDPDENNKNDTYGFGFPIWTPNLWNPWGLNMSWYVGTSIDETGTVHMGTLTDQFREGCRYWNRLWNEKLINRDMITNTSTVESWEQVRKTGIVSDHTLRYTIPVNELGNWESLPFPVAPNTGKFLAGGVGGGNVGGIPNQFLISAKTKSVEACLRWLDYFYTMDGAMMWNYGPQGVAYSKIGNNYKLYKGSEALAKPVLICNGVMPLRPGMILAKSESEMNEIEKFLDRTSKKALVEHKNAKYNGSVLRLLLTADEQAQLQNFGSTAGGSVAWGYEAIRGERNIETEWSSYLGQYPNSKKAEKIYQDAFKRLY